MPVVYSPQLSDTRQRNRPKQMTTTTLDQRINLFKSMTCIDLSAALFRDGFFVTSLPLHISDEFVLVGETLHNRSDVTVEKGPANFLGKPSTIVSSSGWKVIAA